MDEKELTRKDIEKYLEEVNKKLKEQDKQGEILLAGGAALTLVYNARNTTKDIDAVFKPTQEMREIIKDIAKENSLKDDWLNDGAKAFMSPSMNAEKVKEFSNLNVMSLDTESLLAMKLAAARRDSYDMEDSITLMKHLNLSNKEQLYNIIEKHIPDRLQTPKIQYFAQESFEMYQAELQRVLQPHIIDGNLNDEVPVSYIKKTIDSELYDPNSDLNKKIKYYKNEILSSDYKFILDESNRDIKLDKLVAQKIFQDDFDKLNMLKKQASSHEQLYLNEKKIFDATKKPNWYNPIERYSYAQQEKQLALMEQKANQIRNQIKQAEKSLNEKIAADKTGEIKQMVNKYGDLLNELDKTQAHKDLLAKNLDGINKKLDSVKDKDQIIPFKGDWKSLDNISNESAKLSRNLNKILNKEKINDRMTKIEKFNPNNKLQENYKLQSNAQEYLKQAQAFTSKKADINDEVIAKNMLANGFSRESVAFAIASHSPKYVSKNNLRSANDLVKKVSKSPEMKNEKNNSLQRGMER